MILSPGKLPGNLLDQFISRYIRSDPSVLIGPGIGRDAAAIDLGDTVLVVKTDPITFPTADAGRYLVHVNANDIVCMGASPRWLLVTALLPERSTTPDLVEHLFMSLASAADELGIALAGGHTEITLGIDRPILIGQMIGQTRREDLLDARSSQTGDAVLLCSGIAIEGTAILATEASLDGDEVSEELLASARHFLKTPGISVVPAATALQQAGVTLKALHDPTEGGIMTAIAELAAASERGIEVDRDAILVLPETRAICRALNLDPYGLIASGALLAVVSPAEVQRAIDALQQVGIPCARVGTLLGPDDTSVVRYHGEEHPLPTYPVDEIARFFASQSIGE